MDETLVAADDVEGLVFPVEVIGIALLELDVRDALVFGGGAGGVDCEGGVVEADDVAVGQGFCDCWVV